MDESINSQVLTCQELLDTFQAASPLTSDRFTNFARVLSSINIAIEPDVLSGAKTPKPADKVVLFSHPGSESSRTSDFKAALLILQLSSAVAMADGAFGAREFIYLHQRIQGWTHLTSSHQRRLVAYLRLLTTAPVTLGSLRKKLQALEQRDKESIATLMASLVQSDGVVEPAEVKMLEKVYRVLGVEPKRVYSDVHAIAAGALPAEVATIEAAEVSPASPTPVATAAFSLDAAKIAALQHDSAQVASLLADIFKEDEDATASAIPEQEPEPEEERSRPTLLGLDETHESFARMLLSRPTWSREELLAVALDLELMLDGALEHVNEASFDALGAPFTEGEDPLEVNAEVLRAIEQ